MELIIVNDSTISNETRERDGDGEFVLVNSIHRQLILKVKKNNAF